MGAHGTPLVGLDSDPPYGLDKLQAVITGNPIPHSPNVQAYSFTKAASFFQDIPQLRTALATGLGEVVVSWIERYIPPVLGMVAGMKAMQSHRDDDPKDKSEIPSTSLIVLDKRDLYQSSRAMPMISDPTCCASCPPEKPSFVDSRHPPRSSEAPLAPEVLTNPSEPLTPVVSAPCGALSGNASSGRTGVNFWRFQFVRQPGQRRTINASGDPFHNNVMSQGTPLQLLNDAQRLGITWLRHTEDGDAYLNKMWVGDLSWSSVFTPPRDPLENQCIWTMGYHEGPKRAL